MVFSIKIKTEKYKINALDILEIVKYPNYITPMPLQPKHSQGVFVLRERDFPIIGDPSKLIMITKDNIGISIDSIEPINANEQTTNVADIYELIKQGK